MKELVMQNGEDSHPSEGREGWFCGTLRMLAYMGQSSAEQKLTNLVEREEKPCRESAFFQRPREVHYKGIDKV